MIVYSATKGEFNNDVIMNRISGIILDNLRAKHISGGQNPEFNSWQNSLQFMRNVIDDRELPDDVNIAIEYQIPRTSKRVDFMIAGADHENNNNVVIVELKQWTKVEKGINWLRELKSPQVGSHTYVQVWLDHDWSKDRSI